jgi:hypothetical protein
MATIEDVQALGYTVELAHEADGDRAAIYRIKGPLLTTYLAEDDVSLLDGIVATDAFRSFVELHPEARVQLDALRGYTWQAVDA